MDAPPAAPPWLHEWLHAVTRLDLGVSLAGMGPGSCHDLVSYVGSCWTGLCNPSGTEDQQNGDGVAHPSGMSMKDFFRSK